MICFAPVRPDRTHNSLTQVHKNHGRREKSAGRHVRIFEKKRKRGTFNLNFLIQNFRYCAINAKHKL